MIENQDTDYVEGIWIRLLFMLLFVAIYSAAELIVFMVAVIQFGYVAFSGQRNRKLIVFGGNLSVFIYQIIQFFVFRSNTKPFPFDDWPSEEKL